MLHCLLNPGMPESALEAGDSAWFAEDRAMARACWREAALDPDPATAAMAHARLMRVSGNLGYARHARAAERALARCTGLEASCDLAEADLILTARDLGLTEDVERAALLARRAARTAPEEAAERQRWAEQSSWPAGPGTWFLGLGVSGAPGLGVGAAASLVHPDLLARGVTLDASVSATSRGAAGLTAVWQTPQRLAGTGGTQLSRGVYDRYDAAGVEAIQVDLLQIWAGPLWRWSTGSVALGATARMDRSDGAWQAGHGPWATVAQRLETGPLDWSARLRGTAAWLDYPLLRVDGTLTALAPLGPLTLAGLGTAEWAPWNDAQTPFWRLPALGGAAPLRGAPVGRLRGEAAVGGALELRLPLGPHWGVVGFGEVAWLHPEADAGLHPGGGVGLRLRLPPQPANTVRLDLGVSDLGWGLTAGWGEAF